MSVNELRAGRPRLTVVRSLVALLGALAALVAILGPPPVVSAHTGFESSTPADGSTVDEPVEEITITFTGDATPVGDRFVALTPDGAIQEAASIETPDDRVFEVRFDPPLAGGPIGVRWTVQAADSHPIEGAFSFTVDAPAETSTTAASTTATTQRSAPSTTVAAAVSDSTAPVPTEPADAEPATAGPDDTTATGAVDPSDSDGPTLEEFLVVDGSTPGETTALVGRVIGFTGVALGIGALAFVATALRGGREEIAAALVGVRVLGGVVAAGAVVEYVGTARIGDLSLADAWTTAPGFATVLRVVGGVGLALGVAGSISRSPVQRRVRRPSAARSLSAAVVDDITRSDAHPAVDPVVRWRPTPRSWPALAGAAVIVASFWFDGHTVSRGSRPLHALVNSVHVLAGAVWVGGVVTMGAIVWSRHRSGRPMRAVELVVRFSKIATISLGTVVAAGAIMAVLVLDTFGDLTGTQWGRILLLKTSAVVLAMACGANNHFRLLPALEEGPESPELLARLRSTVTAEAILLVFVVVVTAWLVAAAT
ncbi:copper resistance CopC/CopD family protein [Ilumatobacter sp.]|uniref:copper resistance CopC/CopD family protein n=1 Tax=Ilumatobacter sp. TaxID=1967498 RepID=UPI003B52FEA3